MVLKRLLFLFLLIILAGCATTRPPAVERTADFQRPAGETTLYFVPFAPVLAPEEFSSALFNQFVDGFDGAAAGSGLSARILKPELATIDKAWLTKHYYATGEVFAYRQESGCCSTEIRLSTRLLLYQPATDAPVLRLTLPYQTLFDHDRSNLDLEKERMVATLAEELRALLLNEIAPP